MSYAPSTGSKNRESLGQNVFCRIVIALVGGSARGTDPLPHGQIKIGKDMFAARARFRGGVPLVDLHQHAPVPAGFVVRLATSSPSEVTTNDRSPRSSPTIFGVIGSGVIFSLTRMETK